jgi:CRISPR/Cas system-associated endonuclease Cas1
VAGLHADKDKRASLAYDLMEPARPILYRWFFHWLQSATFGKRDFFEDYRGQIRLMRPSNSRLAMTAALWREIADQLAQWFYKRLSGKNASLRLKFVNLEIEAGQTLRVDATYAVMIKNDRKIPHPRFYRVLAELAEVDYPFGHPT